MSKSHSWIDLALAQLADHSAWGYHAQGPSFTEPTALAAAALASYGRVADAARPLDWLVERQSKTGSLGVSAEEPQPHWPTGLAVVAWLASGSPADPRDTKNAYAGEIARAVDWITQTKSHAVEPTWGFGHDTMLVGWPWVQGTHAWVEPTAMQVVALKASGHWQHPRTREAVRLLKDRLCPAGGCNYGNTTVLENQLPPHMQPSGWALLALAGETDPSGRLAATIDYAEREQRNTVSTASLCFAVLGLTAHGRHPRDAQSGLDTAWNRTQQRGASAYKLALLLLAARADGGPLVTLPKDAAETRLHDA